MESDTLAVNKRGADAPIQVELKEFMKQIQEKVKRKDLEL